MQKIFLYANIRIITQPQDHIDLIEQLFYDFVPVDFAKEKLALEHSSFEGESGEERFVFELALTKSKHIRVFTEELFKHVTVADIDSRIDEDCILYLRLDLDKFLDGTYELVESGRCVHIALNIAAFPKTRENAIVVLKSYLNNL